MIKTFLVYFPSVFVARASAFLTVIIASHLLQPNAFGYFSLIAIIGEFTDTATTAWLRIAISRFGSVDNTISRQFAIKMARVACACTLTAIVLAIASAQVLSHEQAFQMSLAVAAYVFAAGLLRFGVTLHQAMGNKLSASLIEGGRAVLMFSAAVIAMRITGNYFISSLAGSSIGFAGGIVAVLTSARLTTPSLPNSTTLKTLLHYAIPLVLLTILTQVMTVLDKVLLKSFHDARTLGFYSAAFAVGRSGFDVIANSFNIGGFVQLASLYNTGRESEAGQIVSRQLIYILGITVPAAALLISARGLIAEALFPKAYFQTFVVAIPFVAIGAIAFNIKNFVYDNIFHLYLRNMRQLPTLIVGAIVAIAVGATLIPIHPVIGAAGMFSAGGLSSMAMSIWLSSRLLRVPFPWKSLLTAIFIGGVAALGTITIENVMGASASKLELLFVIALWGAVVLSGSVMLWHYVNKVNVRNLAAGDATHTPYVIVHIVSSLSDGEVETLIADVHPLRESLPVLKHHVVIVNGASKEAAIQTIKRSGASVHLAGDSTSLNRWLTLLKPTLLFYKIQPDIVKCCDKSSLSWCNQSYLWRSKHASLISKKDLTRKH